MSAEQVGRGEQYDCGRRVHSNLPSNPIVLLNKILILKVVVVLISSIPSQYEQRNNRLHFIKVAISLYKKGHGCVLIRKKLEFQTKCLC